MNRFLIHDSPKLMLYSDSIPHLRFSIMNNSQSSEKRKNEAFNKEKNYIFFFIFLFGLLGFLLAFNDGITDSVSITPCYYTSNRGISGSRIDKTTMPRLEIETNDFGAYTFYVLDEAGARFCEFSSEESQAVASPDGLSIAFISKPHATYPTRLFVSTIEGANVTELAADLQYPRRFPIWSPDSQRIAFTHGDISNSVYIVAPDGSNLQGFELEGATHYPNNWGVWSPNSQWFAIAVRTGPGDIGNAGIYLMNRAGTSLEQLSQGQADNLPVNPRWDETGEFISFASGGEYSYELRDTLYTEECRISIETRVLECDSVEAFRVP